MAKCNTEADEDALLDACIEMDMSLGAMVKEYRIETGCGLVQAIQRVFTYAKKNKEKLSTSQQNSFLQFAARNPTYRWD